MTSLSHVLRTAMVHLDENGASGLKRGLNESAKALDRGAARLCVLADDCDEPAFQKLIKALCQEHGVQLLSVPNGKKLGEWCGLCKIDAEGNARKTVNCSVAVVTDYGEETSALSQLLEHMKSA